MLSFSVIVVLGFFSVKSNALVIASSNSTVAYLNQRCGQAYNAVAYAGTGNNAISGLCCSQYGYAGVTDDHCGGGCQLGWGRCGINQPLPPVHHGCNKNGQYALTFDDGPTVLTTSLLNYLKNASVKATFFINGINWKASATGNPLPGLYALKDALIRADAEGHQICSHTWSHTDFITVNQYNATYEVTRLNRAFKAILGKIPTCIRPPYGDYDNSTLRILQGLGYGDDSKGAIVDWNLDPVDWDPPQHGNTPKQQINDMVNEINIGTVDGPLQSSWLSLMHDTQNTTADFRVNGSILKLGLKPFAQRAVEYLKPKGWTFVRLDQCMGQAVGSMYRAPNANDDVCGDVGTCFT